MNTLRNLLQSLRKLLGSWWQVDRIRVSSATGRLFQLLPGDRLLIGEQILVVRTRSPLKAPVEENSDESAVSGVEYRLDVLLAGGTAAAECAMPTAQELRLRILLPVRAQPAVFQLWNGQAMEELWEEEIVALGKDRDIAMLG